MSDLYAKHIAYLLKRYRVAMDKFNVDAIVLSSGHKTYYFQDDLTHPFRAYSGAQQWLPFTLNSDIHIVISKNNLPTLLWPIQDDFWHAKNSLPAGNWHLEWDVVERPIEHDITEYIRGRFVLLGPQKNHSTPYSPDLSEKECKSIQTFLDYDKAYKTEFEIDAIARANTRAATGHKAAEQAFLLGKSELCIYHDYLTASGQTSCQEPYAGIIALNENASVLHYENKISSITNQNNTLLIDAGASVHGYASDISRTSTQDTGLFKDILTSVDELQIQLGQEAVSGVDFKQLHGNALKGVGEILFQHKICSLSAEEQVRKGIVQTFFPHGLGHLLGLHVHDVAGHQIDQKGNIQQPGPDSPYLRLTRTLETNMVITIEPGLYFIPMLLAKMQHEIPLHGCDLDKIESLLPFGGIRIEDNIVVGEKTSRNLTREAFDKLS